MFSLKKILIVTAFIFVGCTSARKAELSSSNPSEAIEEVQNLSDNARVNQVDLLAYSQYRSGVESLESAKKGMRENDDRKDILEDLAQSKAYFQEADKVAVKRTAVPARILAARKASLENGVRENRELTKRLNDIDDSLRDRSNKFTKDLTAERLSMFEKDYLKLEVNAVQNANLMVFENILIKAADDGARNVAPKSYRNAYNDLKAAENMIQQSPRNPENFIPSVITADKSAKLLSDVMDKLNGVAKGASEEAALVMVQQERKVGILSDRASQLRGSLSRTEYTLSRVSGDLEDKISEAQSSATKVRSQKAMDDVQKNFSKDEAEVYQQGNDIVLRLKKIDFKSGSAMVPSNSMKLLSKVNSVIVGLQASKIIVEGHTDSTGKSGNNNILSMKRSQAVAKYLDSLDSNYDIDSNGLGETHPIANNETVEGRAMNRRVDIIVSTNN